MVEVTIGTTDQPGRRGKETLVAADASGIGAIRHAAVVVRDLDRAVERYTNERVREGLR
jgi:hypothetical protein